MWNKKDVFFLVIIMMQLITIFYFGVKIIRNKSQGIIVTPIKKGAVVKGISSKLKYFYINNPDTTIEDIVPWTKEIVKYTINSDGLNETTNYLVDKPTNVFRIVTLGDSFTFGQFINTVDNWTELIEDKLQNLRCKNISKFEVINLGTEDYDIQYSVEKFRLKGQKYNPDLVIWFLKDDDFVVINEKVKPFETKIMQNRNLTYDSPQTFYDNGIYYPIGNEAYKIFREKFSYEEILKTQSQFLKEIDEYFSKSLLMMTLADSDIRHMRILDNFTKERGNSLLFKEDLHDEKYRLPDTHPNELGSKKIANDLFNYLKSYLLIQCSI